MGTETDNDKRAADLDRREATLKFDRMRFELRTALSALECRPEGLDDAVQVMATMIDSPEYDDDGRLTKLSLDGKEYESAAAAAKAFLGTRAFFVAQSAPADKDPKVTTPPARVFESEFARTKEPLRAPARNKIPSGTLSELLERGYTASELAAAGWDTPPT